MYFSIILVLILTQLPDAPVAKPSLPATSDRQPSTSQGFELQGDKLGESVETFMAQHPKAECDTAQKPRISCYQWADVAFFGLMGRAAPGCNLKKRYAADCLQGIAARFTDQHLVSLVYTVAGADKAEAAMALRKQLGTPTMESRDGTVWNNGSATISVVAGKAMDENSQASLITISISATN
jgi:hypothetical protein